MSFAFLVSAIWVRIVQRIEPHIIEAKRGQRSSSNVGALGSEGMLFTPFLTSIHMQMRSLPPATIRVIRLTLTSYVTTILAHSVRIERS
jgi:hypothetical protein